MLESFNPLAVSRLEILLYPFFSSETSGPSKSSGSSKSSGFRSTNDEN